MSAACIKASVLLFAFAGLAASNAWAQGGPVQQSGPITPGHPSMFIQNGVLGDGGSAQNGKLKELGITNTGTPLCLNDAPTTNPYHQLCLGANTLGGGLLSYNPYAGATALPFNCIVNGQLTRNCLSGGGTAPGLIVQSVTDYGADPTGQADSTDAINNCLRGVGSNAACLALGKFKILGTVNIPAWTTLTCGYAFLDSPDPAGLNGLPALMVDSSHAITAAGPGAAIKNCLIYRNGMTFPTNDTTAFAGIGVQALYENNAAGFTLSDVVMVGFDTCFYTTAGRPHLDHGMCDGNGVNKAAMELDTGNTDSGTVVNWKIQPISSSGGGCTQLMRAGTGLRVGPNPHVSNDQGTGIWLDRIVSQNFTTADYDFAVTTIAGAIWADDPYPTPLQCSAGPNITVEQRLLADKVWANAGQIGLVLTGNGGTSVISQLIICCTANGGVKLGDSNKSGNLKTDWLELAGFGLLAKSTGIAFTTANDTFETLSTAIIGGQNGSFYLDSSLNEIFGRFYRRYMFHLDTDVDNPYTGLRMGAGSDEMLMLPNLKPTLVCDGLGTGGSCNLSGLADNSLIGSVVLQVGSGAATFGVVTMTFPVPAAQGYFCNATLTSNNGGAANVFTGIVDTQDSAFTWNTNGPALSNNSAITYNCRPL